MEEVKNSQLNDKLSSAYQEIDRLRSKILPKDKSDEAKTQLNSQLEDKLTSAYQENNLLRFKILQSEFKKSRDILRLRLKNNLSVIDHYNVTIYCVGSAKIECKLLISHNSYIYTHLRQMHAASCLLFP